MKKIAASCLVLSAAACMVYVPPSYVEPDVEESLLVSVDQLNRRLTGDRNLVVLHVGRDRASYDAGHVPGARFLALSSIVTEQGGLPNELPSVEALDAAFEAVGVSDSSRVVLYGDLGGLAAARAFFTLDYLGHRHHALLNGGLEAWRAAGRTVATDAPQVARGTLNPTPRPEIVVNADWIRERLNDTTVVLIDARPAAQFRGEDAAGSPRPGHIQGAENIFWRTLIVSEQNPELRSSDVLRALFGVAGARHPAEAVVQQRERERELREERRAAGEKGPAPAVAPLRGSTVVAYCQTGVQASFLYFVSRYLGYETKMYDGSFIDWSRRGTEYPVER